MYEVKTTQMILETRGPLGHGRKKTSHDKRRSYVAQKSI